MDLEAIATVARQLKEQIRRVVVGQGTALDLLLVALLSEGHVLLEGVPGTAKTLLIQAFAASLRLDFGRIQFTPDLMPGDLVGTNLFNFQTNEFSLTKGPVFTQLLLADEINRTPPKTQAALLQCMHERAVTIDGETHDLGSGFMVIATQNPIEQQGTYPLPEAQLDRFLMRVRLGYPSAADEVLIMDAQQVQHPIEDLEQVTTAEEVLDLQKAIHEIYIDPLIKQYIVTMVNATREHESVYLGASPRGSLALMRASQAYAMLEGRDFVQPDDIKLLAYPTLGHRVIVSPAARVRNIESAQIVDECIERVPVPGARARGGV